MTYTTVADNARLYTLDRFVSDSSLSIPNDTVNFYPNVKTAGVTLTRAIINPIIQLPNGARYNPAQTYEVNQTPGTMTALVYILADQGLSDNAGQFQIESLLGSYVALVGRSGTLRVFPSSGLSECTCLVVSATQGWRGYKNTGLEGGRGMTQYEFTMTFELLTDWVSA